jgi:hypothetical protein
MKSIQSVLTLRRFSIIVASAALAACGAGSNQSQNSDTQTAASINSSAASKLKGPVKTTVPPTTTTTDPAPTPTPTPAPTGTSVTDVRIENTSATAAQTNVPVTFGQVFAPGHLLATDVLAGRLSDGSTLPLQVDVKATHPDGSIRHAIISAVVPSLAPASTLTMSLAKGGTAPTGSVTTDSLMRTGFSASVHANIGGTDYYASADDLLKSGKFTSWLSGPVSTEWQVSAPLRTAGGAVHPHLSARFAIRWYPGANKARVDAVVENDWAYEPSPQNFTYDASVLVGGKTVYTKPALTHYHHARWRKLFWYNTTDPQVNVKHNSAYLIASGALPNYDKSVVIPEDAITAIRTDWSKSSKDVMGNGLLMAYMPTTGAHDDIGLLPKWYATYLLSQDSRMKEVMLNTADLAGSYSAHYRDKVTDRPVSLEDHPYMTIVGHQGDTYNPTTKQYEWFPDCVTQCDTPLTHDAPHQPAMSYLPYLVTGDYYYLEELQFWGMWNAFESNPNYRENVKGLLYPEQVRGQAWSLRTIAEAAYISPDSDKLKQTFANIVNYNLDWYTNTYVNNTINPEYANKLGVITNGYALGYDNGLSLAPWMDDFFTSAIGHLSEMGFTKANTLLNWKVQFPISRMMGTGTCWIDAAIYNLRVHDTATGAFYTTIGEAYTKSHTADFNALQCNSTAMATALGLQVSEMTGYSLSTAGYPSNMQPALAYAANVGGTQGKSAWTLFMSRSVKPDYRYAPQFAIVPR